MSRKRGSEGRKERSKGGRMSMKKEVKEVKKDSVLKFREKFEEGCSKCSYLIGEHEQYKKGCSETIEI